MSRYVAGTAAALPANPGESAPRSPETAALLGGGVAFGMSECDVVLARGSRPPSTWRQPNGREAGLDLSRWSAARRLSLRNGRLSEMDRVAGPPPPENKTVKKKPAKSGEPKAGEKS